MTRTPQAFRTITADTRRRSRDRERAALAVLAWWLMRLWQLCLVEYARRHAHGYRGRRHGDGVLDIGLLVHQFETNVAAAISEASVGIYRDTMDLWSTAAQEAAGGNEMGWRESVAALDALTALEGFQARDEAWQPRLRDYVLLAVRDIDRILRAGLEAGTPVLQMAKSLRNYVVLSAKLDDAFPAERFETLRTVYADLPGEATEAGRAVQWQTRRITVSEIYDARFAAEIRAMTAVPAVNGLQWTLSPAHNSGVPDICDVLAKTDWYAMGAGIFPVGREPKSLPHPHCRCELVPVFGVRDGKPPKRVHSFDAVSPYMDVLTDNAAGTLADNLDRFFW
jgi:hypothetical protein